MVLDDSAVANASSGEHLTHGAAGRGPRMAAPASLVLFVGTPPPSALCDLLAQDGMRSLWLAGPAQALHAANLARFDALVIDASLLGSRTATWLGELRARLACPLLLVAERADEIDEILALELGADAYLARPLAARRLRAHLAALMRLRQPSADHSDRAAGPGWQVDCVANRLLVAGRSHELTEVQSGLLRCLTEAQGRIVPRAALAAALPGGAGLSARSVDVYIHRLRRRLSDAGVDQLAIEAVRGRGYTLKAGQRPIGRLPT